MSVSSRTSPANSPVSSGGKAPSGFADTLLLLAPGLIWGTSFLFIAEGLESIGPYGVAFVRILVGALTLAMLPAARKPLPRSDWPAVARLGFVWFALPLTLFPLAELRVTSALTGMLNGAVPLFAAGIGMLLTRKAPSRNMALGLALGLGGAVMVALPALGEGHNSAVGVGLIVLALVSYGLAVHLARPLQMAHGSLPVISRALGVAAVMTAPFAFHDLMNAHWAWGPALSLLALGVFGTGIAFALMATATGRLGATRASATAFVIPAVALALGVLVRDERVAALSIFGAAVCLAGAAFIRRAQDR